MISIVLIIFLKLCLGQEYFIPSQDNNYLRTSKVQNDNVFTNLYDWKNNFDNNIIIPDAYVFNYII